MSQAWTVIEIVEKETSGENNVDLLDTKDKPSESLKRAHPEKSNMYSEHLKILLN